MSTLSVSGEVVLDMKPWPAKAVSLIKQNAVTEYGMLASDLLDFIEYLEENPTTLPSLKNSIGSGDTVPMELHHT
jgi:long-chain acyl-CoA synthetase